MKTRKVKQDSSVNNNTKETNEHYNAILLEDIRSTIELVMESVQSRFDGVKRDMSSINQKMANVDIRFGSLEATLFKQNDLLSGISNTLIDLKKNVQVVKEEMELIKENGHEPSKTYQS